MAITTKDQLKAYILRQLGQGINRIEVTDAQLNDAIENAISYFEQEVDGGLEEKILVIPISAGLQEYYLAPEVMGIMEVISSRGMSSSSDILSSMTQYKMDSASALTIGSGTGGLKYYVSNMQYMAMLDQFLGEGVTFSFNSTTKKLTIHETVTSDSVMVMTTLWSIRNEPEMWNNQFIKEYSTALAMHQWGRNMSKFNGAAIVGNFELNGSGMIQMADAEISRLREELVDKHTSPLGIFFA